MSLTIIRELDNLNDFKFWGGAVARWEKIKSLGLENDVLIYLEERQNKIIDDVLKNIYIDILTDNQMKELKKWYPLTLLDGYLTATALNDFVWFEFDDFIEEMEKEQKEKQEEKAL